MALTKFKPIGTDESTPKKGLWMLSHFIIFLFLFFAVTHPSSQQTAIIYMILWTATTVLIGFDYVTKSKKMENEYIDTITDEGMEKRPLFFKNLPSWVTYIVGGIIFLWLLMVISSTKFSLVGYPSFQIADEIFDNPLFKSMLSAVAGVVETRFWVGILMPTIAVNSARFLPVLPFPNITHKLVALIIFSFLFMPYHLVVYGGDYNALTSAISFMFISGILSYIFASTWLADHLHFWNNFFAKLIETGTKIGFVILP